MQISAFRGLRYGTRVVSAGALAAPPFDQISDRLRDELCSASPYHFAHLTRPTAANADDAYSRAAGFHSSWLTEEVVVRDSTSALYLYRIELPSGGVRLGLTALVELEDPETRVIRPHEETTEKAVVDRLALLRAMQVDLEPILLLAEDAGELDELLAADTRNQTPFVEHTDAQRNRHALFRLQEPARIREYQRLLAPRYAAIADGHHRYRVACMYAAETGASPGTAARAKLAVITSLAAPELRIDPIHRSVHAPLIGAPPDSMILSRNRFSGPGGAELARAVAEERQPAVGVWLSNGEPEIWRLAPVQDNDLAVEGELSVVLLHRRLLPAWGLRGGFALDGTVQYRADPSRLFEMIASGEAAAGFWLPPISPTAFAAYLDRGELLPPKATRFLPKLASGLVWAQHRTPPSSSTDPKP